MNQTDDQATKPQGTGDSQQIVLKPHVKDQEHHPSSGCPCGSQSGRYNATKPAHSD